MATTDAVSAVCDAMVHILRTTLEAERDSLNFGSGPAAPRFEVYTAQDFTNNGSSRHIRTGASLFLYRVLPNLAHRTPAGRVQPDGQRQRSQLPLDLHVIVTIWGEDPTMQNRLVGWVLRTLEDYPSLPAAVLNVGRTTPVFQEDESAQLVIGEMEGDELLQLWDMLGNGELYYQISIPYIVRNVQVESHRLDDLATVVQTRGLDIQRIERNGP